MSNKANLTMLAARIPEKNQMVIEGHDVNFSITTTTERIPNMHELSLTPSRREPGSFSVSSLASHHAGVYIPNPSELRPKIYNLAGDVPTPWGTHSMMSLSHLNRLHNPPHNSDYSDFEPFNPRFAVNDTNEINNSIQQTSFAPIALMYPVSGYDVMHDDSADNSYIEKKQVETASSKVTSTKVSASLGGDMSYAEGQKLRFKVSLCAPTAMLKNLKEIPITYLNKGQAYKITVMDSGPPMVTYRTIQYRTSIRVCFEEEEQRAKPSTCWQVWKEGRGSNEAPQRGGKLSAVEIVDSLQGGEAHNKCRLQVESTCVDGFCVTWSPKATSDISECNIPVRFNFLSTDFSYAKGIKGVPVRLCAKTELLLPSKDSGARRVMESSYCKVKLFRDHGAERKLRNDIAHVKKTIHKLRQKASQAAVCGPIAKNKQGKNHSATAKGSDRTTRLTKYERTILMDLHGYPVQKIALEDDMRSKLTMLQNMFSSTRSMSVFGLCSDETDDPDLYPVRLPGCSKSFKFENTDCRNADLLSAESMFLSLSNTHASRNSPLANTTEWKKCPSTIRRILSRDQVARRPLQAVEIDPVYIPPSEQPVACFYVRLGGNEHHLQNYYHAIYLSKRTAHDLVKKISLKYHIDPVCIMRIIRVMFVNGKAMRVMVDDDVVNDIPEGQDMIVRIDKSSGSNGSQSGMPGPSMEIQLSFQL